MRRRWSLDTFVTAANEAHGHGSYDYSLCEFTTLASKVIITCSTCKTTFSQVAKSHLAGHGCWLCGSQRSAKTRSTSPKDFRKRAQAVHGDKYAYLSDYKSMWDKVKIQCTTCGECFLQAPANHLSGHGCRVCGYEQVGVAGRKMATVSEFISASIAVHGPDAFSYALVTRDLRTKDRVRLTCLTCNLPISPQVGHHLRGARCRHCTNRSKRQVISQAETSWLDSLGVKERQYPLALDGSVVHVDGYDKDSSTAYEFLGDYWHGNPDVFCPTAINTVTGTTFGDLHARTLARIDRIRRAGNSVVVMWEHDFRKSARP